MNKTISKQDPIKGYKIFNSDWTCRDKQYALGETYHESEVELCSRGMHFCTKLEDCFDYYDSTINNRQVAKVAGYGTVDYSTDDSKVAVSDLKIIKELTLKDSKKLREAVHNYYHIPKNIIKGIASEEEQLKVVKEGGYNIKYIYKLFGKVSEKVQLAAVKNYGYAITYINNPSDIVQLEAIKKGLYLLGCFYPSEVVQLYVVRRNGDSIRFINKPTSKVQLAAVKQSRLAIGYISNPSKQAQLEAIKEDNRAIKLIKKPYLVVRMANIWYTIMNKFK